MDTKNYISATEFLMGRDVAAPPTPEMIGNYNTLIPRVNEMLELFFKANPNASRLSVNSGYRTPEVNAATKGAAPQSNHMRCAAVDLRDDDRLLSKWMLANLKAMETIGLWMEDPKSTPTWVHFQIFPPKSGRRVYLP